VFVLAGVAAALWVDDAEDVWEVDVAMAHGLPAGADALGILRGLLTRGEEVVSYVNAGALVAAALATLRKGID